MPPQLRMRKPRNQPPVVVIAIALQISLCQRKNTGPVIFPLQIGYAPDVGVIGVTGQLARNIDTRADK